MLFEDTAIEKERVREAGQAALDWQKLYDWTQSQPDDAVLGRSCVNTGDPLGKYLGDVTGTLADRWSIGPSIKTGYGDRLDKPEWVKQLILETDKATGNVSGDVTREMYLRALLRVKPDVPVEEQDHPF